MISHWLPEGLYLFVMVMMISHWLPKGLYPFILMRFVLINLPHRFSISFAHLKFSVLFVLRIALPIYSLL